MKKAMLIIMDGFGINNKTEGNAVFQAKTPFLDGLFKEYPASQLKTFGKDVGLPEGIMGNSEVGHLNIGAGRVVYQLNTLIDHKIDTGEFFENPALLSAIEHSKQNNSDLHLMGLISDGGVHSSLGHLYALLDLCEREGLDRVYIHCFMDGRDTLPHSGKGFIQELENQCQKFNIGQISTIIGRYYAMDRDNRWERVEKAYKALVMSEGEVFDDAVEAVTHSYSQDITDEFIIPKIIKGKDGTFHPIKEHDSVIFFNFRSDRAREISRCFIMKDFEHFEVMKFQNLKYISMTEYDINFESLLQVAFRNEKLENILAKVFADHHVNQLRLAETEKYAHVSFFFNGGVEQAYQGEDRILVPSPKVASYDLQPEMSAYQVKDEAIKAIESGKYDAIIMNFANCDMVGHTGVMAAAIKAVETVDHCMSEIIPIALDNEYQVLITADHGNAEQMIDDLGNIMTAHSLNPVPFCIVTKDKIVKTLSSGVLADIAPTMLKLMEIDATQEMTGQSLIKE